MMHRDDMMSLYQAEHFQAVGLNLADSGTMYFFLPKEGCIAQNIAADPEMIRICMDPSGMNSDYPLVHLTVPKFTELFHTGSAFQQEHFLPRKVHIHICPGPPTCQKQP